MGSLYQRFLKSFFKVEFAPPVGYVEPERKPKVTHPEHEVRRFPVACLFCVGLVRQWHRQFNQVILWDKNYIFLTQNLYFMATFIFML